MIDGSIAIQSNMFNLEEKQLLERVLKGFSFEQLQWLAGYITGLQHSSSQLLKLVQQMHTEAPVDAAPLNGNYQPTLTILYGTKTGNSKKVAGWLVESLQQEGIVAKSQDMNAVDAGQLTKYQYLIVIVSTHGEGDPPPAAEDLHSVLMGRKAPTFDNTRFAVLGLGDSSYASFCQTSKDFDKRLYEQGAHRILDRVECDVEFEEPARQWVQQITHLLKNETGAPAGQVKIIERPVQVANVVTQVTYSRQNPFQAQVLEKIRLNGRGSIKQTYHLELSLEGSGLRYEPGDALGVFAPNDSALVDQLMTAKNWNREALIQFKANTYPFGGFLTTQAELTTVSGAFLKNYALAIAGKNSKAEAEIHALLAEPKKLNAFVYGKDVWDILDLFPASLTEQEFAHVVHPLQVRLYSIASSYAANPGEVHLTIGRVAYEALGRNRRGLASGFIADEAEQNGILPVFISSNEMFRLPADPDVPVIMVGPGTGVAPFRAFLQERQERGSKGKNWLFFGDQHFSTDFLYQLEWQNFLKKGVLSRINAAFSRDTGQKVYVQHKMHSKATELYAWLQEGAHFYVCGDAKKMAKDVKQALVDIIAEQGGKSLENAELELKNLIKSGRYLEDTY